MSPATVIDQVSGPHQRKRCERPGTAWWLAVLTKLKEVGVQKLTHTVAASTRDHPDYTEMTDTATRDELPGPYAAQYAPKTSPASRKCCIATSPVGHMAYINSETPASTQSYAQVV